MPAQVVSSHRRPDDLAISPVVAAVTMVGIAVVLSAGVFLVSRGLAGGDGDNVPPIGFIDNEVQDRSLVPRSEPDADWSHISASSSVPARFALNVPVTSSSPALPADTAVLVSDTSRPVMGGDALSFCADTFVPTPAVIQLIYDDRQGAHQVLRDIEFTLLAPCV